MRISDDSSAPSRPGRHQADAGDRDPLAEPQHEHADVVAGGRVVLDRAAAAHRSGLDVDRDARAAGRADAGLEDAQVALRRAGSSCRRAPASPSLSTRR